MIRLLAVALGVTVMLPAQDLFPKHYINGGFGIGLPRGEINQYFKTKPAGTINYGYRFHRYFQADAGYDIVFHAADVNDYLNSEIGSFRIKDYQHFVTF